MAKMLAEASVQQPEPDIDHAKLSDVPATHKADTVKTKTSSKETPVKALATGRKRKRATAVSRQPVKGGFTLPHGMGLTLGVTSEAGSSRANNGEEAKATNPVGVANTVMPDVIAEASDESLVAAAKGTIANAPDVVSSSSESESSPGGDVSTDAVEDTDATILTTPDKELPESKADLPLFDGEVSVLSSDMSAGVHPSVGGDTKDGGESALDTKAQQRKKGTRQASTRTKAPLSGMLMIKGAIIQGGVATKARGNAVEVDASKILTPDKKVMAKKSTDNPYQLMPGMSPFPWRRVPTAADCETVHKILVDLHGECNPPPKMPAASLQVAGCGEVPCVLDALLRTLISGNTQMERANTAIQKLASTYGLREHGTGKGSINWEKVRAGSHEELTLAIRTAGDGPKRSRYIKTILDMVHAENTAKLEKEGIEITETTNLLSLDHMRAMTKDEAIKKFVSYPGIGVKTAACVTLFCLQIPCFAVDTHVHRFSIWLGWAPPNADPDTVYRHGDVMVPDHLKYGLHQLFIRHGQTCYKCRKITRPGTQDWDEAPDCPLEHLLTRNKEPAPPPPPPKPRPRGKRKKSVEGEDDQDSDAPKPKRVRNARAKKPEETREVLLQAEKAALEVDAENSDTEDLEAEEEQEEKPSKAQEDDSDTEVEEPPKAREGDSDTEVVEEEDSDDEEESGGLSDASDEDWDPRG